MPKEVYPSSYLCDCGFQSDHFENTINELKQVSLRGPQRLGADDGEHVIIFDAGEMTAMWCPKAGKDIPANKSPQRTVHPRRVGQR